MTISIKALKKQIASKTMKKFMLCLLGIGALIGNAPAVEPKAVWMEGAVGVGWRFGTGQSEIEAWNVTTLVNQVKTIPGVSYVLFNLSQAAHGDQYIAPHSVLTTLNPGSTPVTRDLFMEAATAFQNEGYKVIAYVATQGPPMLKHGVQYAWDRVEIEPGVYTSQSMDNWEGYVQSIYGNTTRDTYKQAFAEIIVDEYAARYGTLIDGWWFDNGADSMNAPLLHDIVTAHNADVAITFNGVNVDTDYTGGHPTVLAQALSSDDVNETKMLLPIEASTDGYIVQADGHKALGHMFMPAHERWNSGAIVWTVDKAADRVERCTQAGGAWTWNVDVSSEAIQPQGGHRDPYARCSRTDSGRTRQTATRSLRRMFLTAERSIPSLLIPPLSRDWPRMRRGIRYASIKSAVRIGSPYPLRARFRVLRPLGIPG